MSSYHKCVETGLWKALISCSCWPCQATVRSACSATPTWLTDPSPGNRPRQATRDTARQECPCRARLRCPCSGTSNESTRQLCREPFRCRESASQIRHHCVHDSKADPNAKCVGSSVVQLQPDQRAHPLPDVKSGQRWQRSVKQMLRRVSSSHGIPSAVQMLILTSSLGTRIGRAAPRRTDLRSSVSRQRDGTAGLLSS